MEAITFVAVMVGILWLLRWVITHDKNPNAATSGPFAMREQKPGGAEAAQAPAAAPRGKKPVVKLGARRGPPPIRPPAPPKK